MSLVANSLACVRGERLIFTGLDIKLETGDILQITGKNGAGKSSLLRVITGLIPANNGTLSWKGKPISDDLPTFRNQLHYIGHKNPIKDRLSVFENLFFWAKLCSAKPKAETKTLVLSALDKFQLSPLKDVPAQFLSSGQRRRLTLARLLVSERKLWILDEPTVGLDHTTVSKLEILIEDHRRQGGTVLVTTHSRLTLLKVKKLDMDDYAPADDRDEFIWGEV